MNHVVGTAGHVDHGKSSLVRALTGTDPDRLEEERRRGMTIELGFAAWTLPSSRRVGIVDVPGHQRFVRTMVAGAQGVDLVLLVVAADEGVMPQTREHLAICDLLGVVGGVVALTKCDLVDAETVALARAEVAEVVAHSPSLRGAEVVACSAVTGEGLDDLAHAVDRALDRAPVRPDRNRPRLYVDRVFALPGFGPVVTGTLEGGTLHTGSDVLLLPEGLRARVRGLQRHGEPVERAAPGGRTAVNLGGVDREDLRRGMAVVASGTLTATRRLDVRLRTLEDAPAPIRHNAALSLHLGTAETAARVWLLDADELAPGEAGFARLDLATPVAAAPHDRVVLRRPAPQATLGGGVVLDVTPRRHRRRDAAAAAALTRRESADVGGLVAEELGRARLGAEAATLVRATGAGREEVDAALRALRDDDVVLGRRHMARSRWEELREESTRVLGAFHDANPLRAGMPREEWRSRLRLPAALASDVAHRLGADGALAERGGDVGLPGRGRDVSDAARAAADSVCALLDERPLDPPAAEALRAAGLQPALLRHLVDEGRVVRLTSDVLLSATAYAAARDGVVGYLDEHGTATVSEIRDALGATRRVVVPLLETLDAARVTIREGDRRRLRRQRAFPEPED